MRFRRSGFVRAVLAASSAAFSISAFADYVVNQVDYRDPATGDVAAFTWLATNNNNGQVVGLASMTDATGSSGVFTFVYDPTTGTFTRLPNPPGFDGVTNSASGWSINDAGVVAGSTFELSGGRGFTYSGGTYSFHASPGWLYTEGRTISNPSPAHPQGLVVGFTDNTGGSTVLDGTAAYIYDPATSNFATFATPNSYFTIVQGLNGAGQIVGNVIYAFGSGAPRANGAWGFLFTPTTAGEPMLGGTVNYFRINGMPTRARGINDHGVIAAAVRDTTTGTSRSYVGTSAGFQEIAMPVPVGTGCATGSLDSGSFPEGLNNAGQVTGIFVDAACRSHGFVATPAFMPTGATSSGAYTFSVDVVANTPIFIDPPVAVGYDYAVGTGNPLIATVRLPLGIGDNKYLVVAGNDAWQVNAGQLFDFRTHGHAQGVASFSVACVDESAMLDPANARAFPTELTFVGTGKFTGTQRPVTRNVPGAAASVLAGRNLCPRRAH